MARFHIEAGAEIETVTPKEMQEYMDGRQRAAHDRMRGIKFRRLPPMNGLVTAAGIQLGGDFPYSQAGNQVNGQIGPTGGHLWAVRLLSVNGLTQSATPDIVNMQILGGADADFNWWQFTGNNYAFGWGKNELWVEAGEYLQFTSQGAVTAAVGSRVRVRGMLQQVPMEMAAELI